MVRKLLLVSGLVIAASLLRPHIASAGIAAPLTASPGIVEGGNALAQKAQWDDDRRYRRFRHDRYYDRCRYWRRECASRWGRGGWDFTRCLRRHGCGGGG
jgi:hypothetical protein